MYQFKNFKIMMINFFNFLENDENFKLLCLRIRFDYERMNVKEFYSDESIDV